MPFTRLSVTRRRLLLPFWALLALAPLVLAVPGGVTLAQSSPNASPSATVAGLNSALLQVMQQAEALGTAGRYRQLQPVLIRSFDFPVMTKATMGRTWKDLDEAKRQAMTQAFAAFSTAIYAKRFNGFSGELFEILGEKPGQRGTVLVRTHLIKSDGEAVAIDYLTRQFQGDWRIIDVLLGGTHSELAAKRSEYGTIVKNQGFETLLRSLRDKTQELLS